MGVIMIVLLSLAMAAGFEETFPDLTLEIYSDNGNLNLEAHAATTSWGSRGVATEVRLYGKDRGATPPHGIVGWLFA